MNRKFKISVVRTEYFYNYVKQTVTCKLHYRIKANDAKMEYVMNYGSSFIDNNMYLGEAYTATATAKTLPGDTFNIKIGEQISRAKAESQAYYDVMKYFQRFIDWCSQNIMEPIDNFVDKGNGVLIHNERFIDSF